MLGLSMLGSCKASDRDGLAIEAKADSGTPAKRTRMWMTVGERRYSVTMVDTDAARAFVAKLPVTLHMAELNGSEKHADLSQAHPQMRAHLARSGAGI